MNENQPFKPYIPADKVTPELTVTSILVGVILAVVFGAANAYLGLRVGLTVSASIPAAAKRRPPVGRLLLCLCFFLYTIFSSNG